MAFSLESVDGRALAESCEQNRIAGDLSASDEEAGAVGGPSEIKHVAGIEVC